MARLLSGIILGVLAFFAADLRLQAGTPLRSIHHDLNLALEPDSGQLSVIDKIDLEGQGVVQFRLSPSVKIKSAKLNGLPVPLKPLGDGAGRWSLVLEAGGTQHLELVYSGRFASGVEEVPPSGPALPVISDQASYLPPGSGWYAVFDQPGMPSTFSYQVRVSVPKNQKAVTPGQLVQEALVGDRYVATFSFSDPAVGISLFAGPYEVVEREEGGIRVRTYFFSGMEGLVEDYLIYSGRYLRDFSQRIGPYPFQHFHIVAAPFPVGLAYPGLTYMGQRVLALPFIKHSSLAHEILHNWWGNGVYVDYASGNWAEGLTTYLADYALLEARGEDRARARRLSWLRDFMALPAERDQAPRSFVSKTHGASQVVGYNKVAFMLHMLRQELGEPLFDRAIRQFWRAQRFQVAAWAALEQAFSDAAGRDLSAYFSQWLDRRGAPNLALAEVKRQPVAGGGWRLSFTLAQQGAPYSLQVPVQIDTDLGRERLMVALSDSAANVDLALTGKPLALFVDPDFELFRRLQPEEAPPILRDVLLNPQTKTWVLGDASFLRQGLMLANAMLDYPVQQVASLPRDAPFLLIAPATEVDAVLQSHDLAVVPEVVAGKGSARVWAARTPRGTPYVVIAADDLQALSALTRPLPHYGRRGYLVFQGARVETQANWPLARSGIGYRFSE